MMFLTLLGVFQGGDPEALRFGLRRSGNPTQAIAGACVRSVLCRWERHLVPGFVSVGIPTTVLHESMG